jgi:adenine-specific DNA methylase
LAGALYAGRRRRDGSVGDPRKVYEKSLSKIFCECHRVTKDNAKLIFTFHHRSPTAWSSLGKSLLKSRFQVRKVFPVRSEGQSGFHSYKGSLKWDSIFICRKSPSQKLKRPSDQVLQNIANAAVARATAWRKKIRQSRLTFGEADELSLQCSFVVREFSRRKLLPGKLAICMAQLREPSKTRIPIA